MRESANVAFLEKTVSVGTRRVPVGYPRVPAGTRRVPAGYPPGTRRVPFTQFFSNNFRIPHSTFHACIVFRERQPNKNRYGKGYQKLIHIANILVDFRTFLAHEQEDPDFPGYYGTFFYVPPRNYDTQGFSVPSMPDDDAEPGVEVSIHIRSGTRSVLVDNQRWPTIAVPLSLLLDTPVVCPARHV